MNGGSAAEVLVTPIMETHSHCLSAVEESNVASCNQKNLIAEQPEHWKHWLVSWNCWCVCAFITSCCIWCMSVNVVWGIKGTKTAGRCHIQRTWVSLNNSMTAHWQVKSSGQAQQGLVTCLEQSVKGLLYTGGTQTTAKDTTYIGLTFTSSLIS